MIHVNEGAVRVDGTGQVLLSEITVLCLALARNNVSVSLAERMFNESKTEGEITS